MQFLIPIALLGWIPVTLLLFAILPVRLAIVGSIIGGWLILPPSGISLPGFPDFGKQAAIVLGCLLATLIFQPNRLLAFRPRWFDLPVAAWCVCPIVSSLTNGLGLYDGLSGVLSLLLSWGIPYVIGRLYFSSMQDMQLLAIGIAFGGIALILPCLFEMRMSQILMPMVYGMDRFEGTRMGSWRPRIFFATGLELGMWMTAASLSCTWLWKCGTLKRIGSFPAGAPLAVLLLTSLLCRATGASVLLIVGLLVLWLSARYRTKIFLAALLLIAPIYYATRITNTFTGESLVGFIEKNFNVDRAESLGYRFKMENILVQKALEQPVWGWGGWGRNRIRDKYGKDISPTDGMWIIYLGIYGSVGLACWTTMLLLPSWIFLRRIPARRWGQPEVAPMAVLATLLGIYSIDCLLNGFMNITYIVAMGGLASAAMSTKPDDATSRNPRGRSPLPSPMPDPVGDGPPPVGPGMKALGPIHSDPRRLLADRYRSLARSLMGRESDRAAAEASLDHAYSILSEIASAHPDDAEVQKQRRDCGNELAWLLVSECSEAREDPARAIELARRVTHDDPGHADYWTTLGVAHYRAGDPGAAIEALERSVAIRGGTGTSHDYIFLALSHARLGDVEAARHYRGLLAISASSPEPRGDLIAAIDRQIESLSS